MFKNISLYTVFSIIAKSSSLLVLPIISRNLSVEEFGYYIILLSILLTQSVFLFGFENSLNYFFHKFKSDHKRKILVSTQIIFISFIMILCSLLLNVWKIFDTMHILTLTFWSILSVLLTYFSAFLKVSMNVRGFIKVQMVKSITLIFTTYILLELLSYKIEGVMYANIIAIFFSIIISYPLIKSFIVFNFNINILKKVLNYGLPLIISMETQKYLRCWYTYQALHVH